MNTRISVANLVPRLIVRETGDVHYIALLNRKRLLQGIRLYGAIGGAAEMTEVGADLLRDRYTTSFEKGRDARFTVADNVVEDVLTLFESRDPNFCEIDPSREIREELTTVEIPDMPKVLTTADADRIEIHYVKTVRQADDGSGSRRLFHLFEMVVPQDVFEKLSSHLAIKLFTQKDVATTQGGRTNGTSADGDTIGNNLFW